ncbi:MAG TPA: universal stress protein [Phaeodactylibacter sp.]|nr:universal stress protein [Phaeodactylibacter sp.]
MNPNRIIFPTDLSPESQNALRYTYQFARSYNMDLSVLHVYKPLPLLSRTGWIPRRQKSQAWSRLTKFAQIAPDHCIPEGLSLMLRKGDAQEQIVKASKEDGCRFIAMGKKHAYSAFKKIIGTKTTGVIAQAECPVLVIPANFTFRPIHNILIVGGEYQKLNPTVQSCILQMSIKFKADLHYINVEESGASTWALRKELLHNSNFLIQKSVPAEYIYELLPEYIQEHQMDLIVMMSKRQNLFENLFEHAYHQGNLQQIDVPLLVFHRHYLEKKKQKNRKNGQSSLTAFRKRFITS